MRGAPAFLGGALFLLLGAPSSQAAPAPRPAGRQVTLIVGAQPGDLELLEPSIREMLAAKGLKVSTTRQSGVTAQDVAAAIAPPTESTPPLARVLLDFTVPGQGTLFLIDPRRGRVFVRRMALAHGLDAVARASARFVIEQSIDAILEGRDIGVSREEFERSVVPATPPPPPPPLPAPAASAPPAPAAEAPRLPAVPVTPPVPRELLLAGGYEGLAMGAGEYQHAAKLVLALRFTVFQIVGAARLAAPRSIAGDGVRAQLSGGGLGLAGAGRLLRLGKLSLIAGLGIGLDLTRVEPAVTAPDLQPAAAFWARDPSLQTFAEVERVFGRIVVALAVGAEAHWLAERYTVKNGSETRAVFVPRRIRPAAALLAGVVF